MNYALKIDSVSQYFGPKSVLHNVNLEIPVGQFVSLVGPSGCHAKGQLVLKFNGTLEKVENIQVDDLLMGLDSTPRKVLNLVRGTGIMYKINPIKGESFVVNEDHILSLKRIKSRNNRTDKKAGEIIDISVKDYLIWSKTRKGLYKLFRVGIEFPKDYWFEKYPKTSIDPYFLGILLGDGGISDHSPDVTSLDFEIIKETVLQARNFKLKISFYFKENTKAISFRLVGKKGQKNPLAECLRELGLWGKTSKDKFIPKNYLLGSRETRLAILAGLIDTDGHNHQNCFDFSSISEQLCDDVVFLSRSLGFAAYKSGPFLKKCQNDGESICWRVSISGNLEIIPTRIPRKQATARKQKKSVLVTGFIVEKLEEDNFYGFQVDGDNRYLLDDFTVTHNCGKSTLLKAILGTDLPKKGSISTGDKYIKDVYHTLSGPNRNVGIVYQHYSLYDFLTAEENVALGLSLDQTSPFYRMFGGPFGWWKKRDEFLRESREMLTKLKLDYLTSTYPIRMSGGERQRVAIGQALIMKPKILLLDEPFGALDEGTRAELQDLIIALRTENEKIKEFGGIPLYTMLIVTHELNEAIYLSDRIVGLSQHHSEGEHGSTIVYDRPATAFDKRSERDYSLFVAQKDELMKVVFHKESKLNPISSGYVQPELSRG